MEPKRKEKGKEIGKKIARDGREGREGRESIWRLGLRR
jgi:hypothetical protein